LKLHAIGEILNKFNEEEDMESLDESAAGSQKKKKSVEDSSSDFETSEGKLSIYLVCSWI
jgi:hypothetical protein